MWRRGGSRNLTSLTDASVRTDFYSYRDAADELNFDVENWLGDHVETPVAPILLRARKGNGPHPEDSDALGRFAASGLLRTATVRSYLSQIGEHIGPMLLLHHHLSSNSIDPEALSPEGLERAEQAARMAWKRLGKQPDDDQANLRTFLREFDKLSGRLSRWTWTVQTASTPSLITSDAPVGTFSSDNGGWHGILPTGSPVFVPISSTQLLVGEENPLGRVERLSEGMARLVNAQIANEAYDAVFCSPDMSWPPELVLNSSRPTLPKPRITWSKSDATSAPTYPAAYPDIADQPVRALLDSLNAVDTVE
jgi:hypothetical protein